VSFTYAVCRILIDSLIIVVVVVTFLSSIGVSRVVAGYVATRMPQYANWMADAAGRVVEWMIAGAVGNAAYAWVGRRIRNPRSAA
jgi:hypothetical protein